MPYFRRAEDNSRGASAYHGAGGPLAVSDPRYKSGLRGVRRGGHGEGAKANDDFNGAAQDGVGFYQLTQRYGQRWSAADAYLHPAMSRPNLTVQTDALVTGGDHRGRPGDRGALPAPRRAADRPGPTARSSCPAARSAARSC